MAGNTVGADSILSTVRLFHQVGGGVASPFDSWLALRGLRTLPVRMQQHCSNAIDVAEYLQGVTLISFVPSIICPLYIYRYINIK